MKSANYPTRRRVLLGVAAVGLVPLSGCMSKPLRPVEPDGRYCHRVGKSYRPTRTCTTSQVPSEAQEVAAKRFEAASDLLTVYVLRSRWADASVAVPLAVDGIDRATTIPESLVRLRLKPGPHRLSFSWDGGTSHIDVDGAAGEVRFVELNGQGWAWGKRFSWRTSDASEARSRATAAKLVADINLSR